MTTSAVAVIMFILLFRVTQIYLSVGQLDVSITGLSLEFWEEIILITCEIITEERAASRKRVNLKLKRSTLGASAKDA